MNGSRFPVHNFTVTVLVSGLTVNCSGRTGDTPGIVGRPEPPLLPVPLGPIPTGKYCLLLMFTCVCPLTKPTTH